MTKEQAKNIMNDLARSIEVIVEAQLNNVYKIVVQHFKDDITEKMALEQLEDLFYETFEKVYKTVSKKIKETYKKTSPFDVNNLLDLTYKSDGKTLEDRIINYLKQDMPKFRRFEKLYKLLLNESKVLESYVVKGRLSRVASILIIECNENDCHFGCMDYAGEHPADEDIPLPPYHPDCECEYYYIETDDEDDIHDLDLTIEDIKDG